MNIQQPRFGVFEIRHHRLGLEWARQTDWTGFPAVLSGKRSASSNVLFQMWLMACKALETPEMRFHDQDEDEGSVALRG